MPSANNNRVPQTWFSIPGLRRSTSAMPAPTSRTPSDNSSQCDADTSSTTRSPRSPVGHSNGCCIGGTPSQKLKHLSDALLRLFEQRDLYVSDDAENWQKFLDAAERACTVAFGIKPNRDYRNDFSIENYRMLFAREPQVYRDDVCRGVKRIRDGMWVNGEQVEFPERLVEEGRQLAEAGEKLMDAVMLCSKDFKDLPAGVLGHEALRKDNPVGHGLRLSLDLVIRCLKTFEAKYVIFEKNYIEALIGVEKTSRSLVSDVAKMVVANDGLHPTQEILNNFAALNKKSRDCHNCAYALDVVMTCFDESYTDKVHQRLWYLPRALRADYNEFCKYLKNLHDEKKILRVHPKLEHNVGLTGRLEKFHEAYLLVQKLLSPDSAMSRFCRFLSEQLGDRPLDASVDSVLQIPRLFCLFVWRNREEIGMNEDSNISAFVKEVYPELVPELRQMLSQHQIEDSDNLEELQKEIVANPGTNESPSNLAKDLEKVSMKLQRNKASVWNEFVSVILHEEEDDEAIRQRPRLPSV